MTWTWDLTKTIWTRPKQLVPFQNNLDGQKSFWTYRRIGRKSLIFFFLDWNIGIWAGTGCNRIGQSSKKGDSPWKFPNLFESFYSTFVWETEVRRWNSIRLWCFTGKEEKILKGSLYLIPSPSMSREHLNFFGKTLLGVINKLKFVDNTQPCFAFTHKLKVIRLNPGYLLKSFLI